MESMAPYRNDHDAAVMMNEHLEQENELLVRQVGILKAENGRLTVIAGKYLSGKSSCKRCKRVPALRAENTELHKYNTELKRSLDFWKSATDEEKLQELVHAHREKVAKKVATLQSEVISARRMTKLVLFGLAVYLTLSNASALW